MKVYRINHENDPSSMFQVSVVQFSVKHAGSFKATFTDANGIVVNEECSVSCYLVLVFTDIYLF